MWVLFRVEGLQLGEALMDGSSNEIIYIVKKRTETKLVVLYYDTDSDIFVF
jgi:hypothetical protein